MSAVGHGLMPALDSVLLLCKVLSSYATYSPQIHNASCVNSCSKRVVSFLLLNGSLHYTYFISSHVLGYFIQYVLVFNRNDIHNKLINMVL